MRTAHTLTAALPLLLLAACSAEPDPNGHWTGAEISCETFISREMGIPTGDLQFDHDPTESGQAPSYSVTGVVVGGGRTLTYQCDTTFDGDEAWTLDNLTLTP